MGGSPKADEIRYDLARNRARGPLTLTRQQQLANLISAIGVAIVAVPGAINLLSDILNYNGGSAGGRNDGGDPSAAVAAIEGVIANDAVAATVRARIRNDEHRPSARPLRTTVHSAIARADLA